ncbi:hypothetical protein TNCV_4180401 [Trichonephila clavipes]|nr:hypothetical protein TNCV_4180401 [Trichonephila clavipes]
MSYLQQRTKWFWEKRNVAINGMVLIVEDNIPPCQWKLGRIVEIICGSDGKVRVVVIKTATEESPIPRVRKKGPLLVVPLRVWVRSPAPNPPCSCSFAISTVPKSVLLRGLRFSIAFLSLIGTQTVPGSPQFGFRRTSRSPYHFSSVAEGTSQRLPQ